MANRADAADDAPIPVGDAELVLVPEPLLRALARGEVDVDWGGLLPPSPETLADLPAKSRVGQIDADPAVRPWLIRLLVRDGRVAGHLGGHDRPDERGMVEIGYSLDPAYRGRGLATDAARAWFRVGPPARRAGGPAVVRPDERSVDRGRPSPRPAPRRRRLGCRRRGLGAGVGGAASARTASGLTPTAGTDRWRPRCRSRPTSPSVMRRACLPGAIRSVRGGPVALAVTTASPPASRRSSPSSA